MKVLRKYYLFVAVPIIWFLLFKYFEITSILRKYWDFPDNWIYDGISGIGGVLVMFAVGYFFDWILFKKHREKENEKKRDAFIKWQNNLEKQIEKDPDMPIEGLLDIEPRKRYNDLMSRTNKAKKEKD